MTTEFEKIRRLEKEKKITIGMERSHANNFWSKNSIFGKLLNWLTPLFIIFSIFIFIRFGFMYGTFSVVGLIVYVLLIQKIAAIHVRVVLLNEEELFDVAYQTRSITIRDNFTGKVIYTPTNWKTEIANL